mmetsp:Transcript_48390/g.121821  ORF Transcript_48390/g.121821 Transcript_48390/m.121821 type:complete len:620 (-) Transcript_48390:62-1921(-)
MPGALAGMAEDYDVAAAGMLIDFGGAQQPEGCGIVETGMGQHAKEGAEEVGAHMGSFQAMQQVHAGSVDLLGLMDDAGSESSLVGVPRVQSGDVTSLVPPVGAVDLLVDVADGGRIGWGDATPPLLEALVQPLQPHTTAQEDAVGCRGVEVGAGQAADGEVTDHAANPPGTRATPVQTEELSVDFPTHSPSDSPRPRTRADSVDAFPLICVDDSADAGLSDELRALNKGSGFTPPVQSLVGLTDAQRVEVELFKSSELEDGLMVFRDAALQSGIVLFSLADIPAGQTYFTSTGLSLTRISDTHIRITDSVFLAVCPRYEDGFIFGMDSLSRSAGWLKSLVSEKVSNLPAFSSGSSAGDGAPASQWPPYLPPLEEEDTSSTRAFPSVSTMVPSLEDVRQFGMRAEGLLKTSVATVSQRVSDVIKNAQLQQTQEGAEEGLPPPPPSEPALAATPTVPVRLTKCEDTLPLEPPPETQLDRLSNWFSSALDGFSRSEWVRQHQLRAAPPATSTPPHLPPCTSIDPPISPNISFDNDLMVLGPPSPEEEEEGAAVDVPLALPPSSVPGKEQRAVLIQWKTDLLDDDDVSFPEYASAAPRSAVPSTSPPVQLATSPRAGWEDVSL